MTATATTTTCPTCFTDLTAHEGRPGMVCRACGYVKLPDRPPIAAAPGSVVHVAGLDLGKLSDFTAFAGIRRTTDQSGANRYDVVSLHRWEVGTPYTVIAQQVSAWMRSPPYHD